MKFVRMPGLSVPVAALALGTSGLESREAADRIYDDYVAAGGNLFDTAWMYRFGEAEALFGDWIRRRGVRDSIAIIGKGAHTPDCNPVAIGRQLKESLDRLRSVHVDVYMMHRDNPAIPVGEFVDAIADEIEAGRIGSYGFSNWTLPRVEEAIAYSAKQRRPKPTSVSNNFSLARMVEPVWAGCIAATEPVWKTRIAAGDLGLYAWSSQARGFFIGDAETDLPTDPEIIRCWSSENNLERRRRAFQLGARRGRTGNQIALAYCLHQPFPIVPIIGPLTPVEFASSLAALEVELSETDLRWLEA